ncbi:MULTISPECIES: CDP-glucose 4,6-dehydratase [Mesorhizobium]|uniref:CDP-glucose 4,6-dehydratase n=1 Tax=Mesorhizobium denitrificans TaxID=2294114 RepID=A0A371X8Y0_9HYPH|nr:MULTISPECIES: CDP-glucose 4,6-dehydratase [Mesorhizobium]RFC65686.1 CDP-glucose 4,6-dehydratase [Mesorhizobium denitrificans]
MTEPHKLLDFERALAGRRVLVTGHTGFKGSWLALWLKSIGAEVHGIALAPDTVPNMFGLVGLEKLLAHNVIDIRDRASLIARVRQIDPEIVFHLAAQPLVRKSFDLPLETFDTNVMGTAHVLEACRQTRSTKAIVCVTTDKVYENTEGLRPYKEEDRLGGTDPYSSSKAAAELVAATYRKCFLADRPLATARGGNVIGGGDWSEDRLIPDIVRAIHDRRPLVVRNPNASRPWQHVLNLCHAYLVLANALLTNEKTVQRAWNFGPADQSSIPVHEVLKIFGQSWMLPEIQVVPAHGKPETQILSLDSSLAHDALGWSPAWSLEESIANTADWYRSFSEKPAAISQKTADQLASYRRALLVEA